MLQGRIQGHTDVFGPPKGWNEKRDGRLPKLYVRKGYYGQNTALVSSYHPTPAEIDAMSKGAPVHLTLLASVQPPVRITIGETPDNTPLFPAAKRVLSCASKGEPQAVVVEFDRPLTEDEIERLRLFLCE